MHHLEALATPGAHTRDTCLPELVVARSFLVVIEDLLTTDEKKERTSQMTLTRSTIENETWHSSRNARRPPTLQVFCPDNFAKVEISVYHVDRPHVVIHA